MGERLDGDMADVAAIHQDKTPIRIHYIAEWAEKRGLKQVDIVREMDLNKSSVSRWFAGHLPAEKNIVPLAALLQIEPETLFRHPDDDWIAGFFADKSEEERERIQNMIQAAFPKTGT